MPIFRRTDVDKFPEHDSVWDDWKSQPSSRSQRRNGLAGVRHVVSARDDEKPQGILLSPDLTKGEFYLVQVSPKARP